MDSIKSWEEHKVIADPFNAFITRVPTEVSSIFSLPEMVPTQTKKR